MNQIYVYLQLELGKLIYIINLINKNLSEDVCNLQYALKINAESGVI